MLRKSMCSLVLAAGLLMPVAAKAADAKAKEYQVTGPIVAIDKDVITVQKGDEKWEIEIGDGTKVDGKLEVGQKVTIHYRMLAKSIDKASSKAPTKDDKTDEKK